MWCITGYLFWPRTGQRPLNQTEGQLIRLFAVNFALGLTLQVDPIAEALDHFASVKSFLAIRIRAVHHRCLLRLGAVAKDMQNLHTARHHYFLRSLLLLVFLFPALAADPETATILSSPLQPCWPIARRYIYGCGSPRKKSFPPCARC